MNSQNIRTIVVAIVGILASFGVIISDDFPDNAVVVIAAIVALIEWYLDRRGYVERKKVVSYVEERPGSGVYAPYEGRAGRTAKLLPGPAVPPPGVSSDVILSAAETTGEG